MIEELAGCLRPAPSRCSLLPCPAIAHLFKLYNSSISLLHRCRRANKMIEELAVPAPGTEPLHFPDHYAVSRWSQLCTILWKNNQVYWRYSGARWSPLMLPSPGFVGLQRSVFSQSKRAIASCQPEHALQHGCRKCVPDMCSRSRVQSTTPSASSSFSSW